MRLYQRALLREMTATAAIALGVLSAILLTTLAVRILGNAALGLVDVSAVMPFIVFGYLRLLPILLSLALFIGVLLTFSRYWQDSEMVIWSGAGLAPFAWVAPVLRFTTPIALLIALMSLAVIPWLSRQKAEYESYLSSRDEEAARLTPGVFAETRQGRRVYFVESMNKLDLSVRNVFIQSEQHGRIGIVVASQGKAETMANGDRFLVLHQGRRYEGTPGAADYRVTEFTRYGFRLDPTQLEQRSAQPRELGTFELLRDPLPANQAEWVWRVGYPISALILAVLAIPLGHYNPRAGRSFNILLAALLYTLYNNIMGLSQTWVARGQINATVSLVLVHGLALALLMSAFWWRYGRHTLRARR